MDFGGYDPSITLENVFEYYEKKYPDRINHDQLMDSIKHIEFLKEKKRKADKSLRKREDIEMTATDSHKHIPVNIRKKERKEAKKNKKNAANLISDLQIDDKINNVPASISKQLEPSLSQDHEVYKQTSNSDFVSSIENKQDSNNHNNLDKSSMQPQRSYIFNENNKGPYGVWIKKIKSDGKEINIHKVGYILNKEKYFNVDILKKNKHRVEVIFKTADEANRFILDKCLAEHSWEAFVPGHRKFRKGIIKFISEEILDEDILKNIKSKAKVIEIERLNRRNKDASDGSKKWIPSQTILVTFEGQDLPNEISLYNVKSYVDPYVFKPLICYKCLQYGHISKKCNNKESCIMCGEHKHDGYSCLSPLKCKRCKKSHKSTDPSCQVYRDYYAINVLMAFDNISFIDAKRQVFGARSVVPDRTRENYPELLQQRFYQNQQKKKEMLIKRYSDVVNNSITQLHKQSNFVNMDQNKQCSTTTKIATSSTAAVPTTSFATRSTINNKQMVKSALSVSISQPQQNKNTRLINITTRLKNKLKERNKN